MHLFGLIRTAAQSDEVKRKPPLFMRWHLCYKSLLSIFMIFCFVLYPLVHLTSLFQPIGFGKFSYGVELIISFVLFSPFKFSFALFDFCECRGSSAEIPSAQDKPSSLSVLSGEPFLLWLRDTVFSS